MEIRFLLLVQVVVVAGSTAAFAWIPTTTRHQQQQQQLLLRRRRGCSRRSTAYSPSTTTNDRRIFRTLRHSNNNSCFAVTRLLLFSSNSSSGDGGGGGGSSAAAANEIPSLLYKEQEKILVQRGEWEGKLMAQNPSVSPLLAEKIKGVGSGGGFGSSRGSSSSSKSANKAQGKIYAETIRKQGVVRIDKVLPDQVADDLRRFVFSLRKESEELVHAGKIKPIERFADVLLKKNRVDMTMPLGSELVATALKHLLLDSPIAPTISTLLGEKALLHEFSCLISDPGSQRQTMHPDTPFKADGKPALYTCFVALQDIAPDMGPTTWLPGSNTAAIHREFEAEQSYEGQEVSPKDKLLRTHPAVLGTLTKGSCAIYDSRTLHCGGANQSQTNRALFYFSFKNPEIGYTGNPPSIRREVAAEQLTLEELQKELKQYVKGKPSERLIHD